MTGSSRPRLLDLFSGAGGAAIGYMRAGWDVIGVDVRPQPNYPGRFVLANAMQFLHYPGLAGIDAIHASPPCQGYSAHVSSSSSDHAGTLGRDEPRLIDPLRVLLQKTGLPYVIENVVGARDEMLGAALLCGQMFGLPINRHRLFETSWRIDWLDVPAHRHPVTARKWAEDRGWDPRDMTVTGKGRRAGTGQRWAEVMGWPDDVPVTQHGLREAIPPAYAEWIGERLLAAVRERAA